MKRSSLGAPTDDDAGSTGDVTEDYRRSFVDALMLELAETDSGVRERITLAFTRLGEDACAALCAEIRDIEDNGGLWNVETRQRRTRGGVWFALLKSRYAWARSPMPRRGQAEGDELGLQTDDRAAREGPEAGSSGRGRDAASGGPPPERLRAPRAAPEPTSTARPRARGASPEGPEIIILRRRRGAL
jgi:hypothetical protein